MVDGVAAWGPLFVFAASGGKKKVRGRIGMCFRPHELSGVLLPELHPTPQRENPAGGRGSPMDSVGGDPAAAQGAQAPCQCLASLAFTLKCVFRPQVLLNRTQTPLLKHTHARTHTLCHLV